VWIGAAITSGVLLLLPEVIKLDGRKHADWLQFVGRFHPLALHVPIGLIVLLPVLELAGIFRPALREAAGFVLGLACVCCFGTLMLGYMLAYGSGDTGSTVIRHMWGGIALSIGLLLCLLARTSASKAVVAYQYPALLLCVLLTLLWTAHQGGTLTHGSGYLTAYMPAPLKRLSAFQTADARDSNTFYGKEIHPVLDANCVACHGARKIEGGLRLDSYEALIKGGKDGAVVVPRDAQRSMLIERITLPTDNKHAMPAEGRPPLKPDEIARIRAWIEQGASRDALTVAGVEIKKQPSDEPIQPVGDYSALTPELNEMAQSQGPKLLPVSAKPSDGLILSTVDAPASFGDAQLSQFQKFGPYIVEADLARTAVTDASFETLSRFTHLRSLHMEGTLVNGHGLTKLAPLSQLTYLNLSETKVDQASVAPLASMKNLHHIYLFDTPAQPVSAADDQPNTRSAQ
jgi:mono/diheme cytochrome c family protein